MHQFNILEQNSASIERLHSIVYGSRALWLAEQRSGITNIETLKVAWAISHFHHYLYENSVTVFTYHMAVKVVLETTNGQI